MLKLRLTLLLSIASVCAFAVGCSGSNGADGVTALTSIDEEPPGPNCEFGGVLVRSGGDVNQNDVLDGGETSDETYLCNGSDGSDGETYLTVASEEGAGANCAAGGVRVDVGLDSDGSGTLEEGEIVATEYVCDGTDGDDGAAGPAGPVGPAGDDGANALVALANEPAGANCAAGGTAVQSGTDLNGNGTLDANEVTATRYACNGEDGTDGMNGTDGTNAGGAEIFNVYNSGTITSTGSDITLATVTFTASGPGTAYVVSTVDAYCPSAASCGNSPVDGYVSNTTTSTGSPQTGVYSYFFLSPNVTENITRSAVFDVTAAGSRSYYFRGTAGFGNTISFYRRSTTVIFFAD